MCLHEFLGVLMLKCILYPVMNSFSISPVLTQNLPPSLCSPVCPAVRFCCIPSAFLRTKRNPLHWEQEPGPFSRHVTVQRSEILTMWQCMSGRRGCYFYGFRLHAVFNSVACFVLVVLLVLHCKDYCFN